MFLTILFLILNNTVLNLFFLSNRLLYVDLGSCKDKNSGVFFFDEKKNTDKNTKGAQLHLAQSCQRLVIDQKARNNIINHKIAIHRMTEFG